jgi:hypothetical protein
MAKTMVEKMKHPRAKFKSVFLEIVIMSPSFKRHNQRGDSRYQSSDCGDKAGNSHYPGGGRIPVKFFLNRLFFVLRHN